MLSKLLEMLKSTYQSLVSKVPSLPAKRSFKTLEIEEAAVVGHKPKDREVAIIDLRFKAWFKHNKIDANALVRHKMRVAFHAGFRSSQLDTEGA